MNKYRELAQRLGYPDEENLEENINSYGDPLPEWWTVMKELQSKLEQAEKDALTEEEKKFIISCLPKDDDVPKGLDPTFYHGLSREREIEWRKRSQIIINKLSSK